MKSWVKFGLIWGLVMFLILNVFFPWYDGEEMNINKMMFFLPMWLIFGVIFGRISQSRNKKIDKQV